MPDRLLSATEAAARLGISPRRVQALVKAGRLPAQRIGRTLAIREADLAAFERLPQGWQKGRARKPAG
jgi:excisionase family DNA binding protein